MTRQLAASTAGWRARRAHPGSARPVVRVAVVAVRHRRGQCRDSMSIRRLAEDKVQPLAPMERVPGSAARPARGRGGRRLRLAPRVWSHCRTTESIYLIEAPIILDLALKWRSEGTERQCDRALLAPACTAARVSRGPAARPARAPRGRRPSCASARRRTRRRDRPPPPRAHLRSPS
jgi:hypothetical protein